MYDSFKQITPENWLQPDKAFLIAAPISIPQWIEYVQNRLLLQSRPLVEAEVKPEDWLGLINGPQLNDEVPEDVRALFEGARGMLAYGYCFYPLCTLAVDQLYRVLEAAVTHRCRTLNGPKDKTPLKQKLEWLAKQGILNAEQSKEWDAARTLRNDTSHPSFQMLMIPNACVLSLVQTADDVNFLFASSPP